MPMSQNEIEDLKYAKDLLENPKNRGCPWNIDVFVVRRGGSSEGFCQGFLSAGIDLWNWCHKLRSLNHVYNMRLNLDPLRFLRGVGLALMYFMWSPLWPRGASTQKYRLNQLVAYVTLMWQGDGNAWAKTKYSPAKFDYPREIIGNANDLEAMDG